MSWNGVAVTVTGGAGFLGSHLVAHLAARGARLRVVDNLAAANANAARNVLAEFIPADICDPSQITAALADSEVVFHLAALADPRVCQGHAGWAFDVNVAGTRQVLDAAQGARRIVFLSSAAVYGDPVRLPIDEGHPLNGQDVYALAKLAAEQVCRMYLRTGLPVTIIRNFNTFGPRQSSNFLIPQMITQALREGRIEIWNREPIRDYLYVENLVEALRMVVEADATRGETINIGRGIGMQTGELADCLAAIMDVPVRCRDQPVTGSRALIADTTKLCQVAGWSPRVSFEEGLARTVASYRQVAAAPFR